MMASLCNTMDVPALFSLVKEKYSFPFDNLKKEQLEILQNLLQGKNAMGILPTGYGKSVCLYLPPLLMDEADPQNAPHKALVISPLRSLMRDQVDRCRQMGIKAVMITSKQEMSPEDIQSVRTCTPQVFFASPEAIKATDWLKCLRAFSKHFTVLAYDEIHCLSEWGSDFRPDYLSSVELRSTFSKSPCLGLSATVNKKVLTDVLDTMQIPRHKINITAVLPDRPNIFLEIADQPSFDFEKDLVWLLNGMKDEGEKYPKTIVFAQSINQVSNIFEFLNSRLGKHAFVGQSPNPAKRILSMYHGQISPELQTFTLEMFRIPKSTIRVLICTIAFGMGVEIPDIRCVVHWGRANSIMGYWQEVGRCGRDGEAARAIWYPKSTVGVDKAVFDELKTSKESCIRQTILDTFQLAESSKSTVSSTKCNNQCNQCACASCTCCSRCKKKCPCQV